MANDRITFSEGGGASGGGVSVGTGLSPTAAALDPTQGTLMIVPELGMFRYDAEATDPADGETCLASTDGVGRWLMVTPDAGWLYQLFDRMTALEAKKSPEFLAGSKYQTFSSLAAAASTAFTITIPGAEQGDMALVQPPYGYLTSNISSYKGLVIVGAVTAADTVTVRITNPNTAAATPPGGEWKAMVMKEAQG